MMFFKKKMNEYTFDILFQIKSFLDKKCISLANEFIEAYEYLIDLGFEIQDNGRTPIQDGISCCINDSKISFNLTLDKDGFHDNEFSSHQRLSKLLFRLEMNSHSLDVKSSGELYMVGPVYASVNVKDNVVDTMSMMEFIDSIDFMIEQTSESETSFDEFMNKTLGG